MSWKEDFYAAVLEYLKSRGVTDAIEVTDVYDQAFEYTNSLGFGQFDYTCDISYKTAVDRYAKVYTYQGKFASLIEDIT